MKRVKIVNIVSRLMFGGVESVIYNYYTNMDTSQFDLYIITMKESNSKAIKKFEEIGFKVIVVDNWEKEPYKVGKKILKILKKEKFDILHTHLSHTNFYFLILAKLAKINVRISHSHLSVKESSVTQKIKYYLYKKIIQIFATHFIACGQDAADNLYGKGKKNVIILQNAINLDRFKYSVENRNKYRNEFKLKENDISIGNIGRMTKQKNQLFLLEIISELKKINPRYYLILIGDGDLKGEILNRINELNLNNNVIILSNREDIAEILNAMDFFILPSLYEGLPVSGVEAQANGLYCFFSNKIDERVNLTNNVKFLEIENDAKYWAKEIDNEIPSNRNTNCEKKLTENGFNIKEQAEKLKRIYLDSLSSRRK